jgi:hypothetical protein
MQGGWRGDHLRLVDRSARASQRRVCRYRRPPRRTIRGGRSTVSAESRDPRALTQTSIAPGARLPALTRTGIAPRAFAGADADRHSDGARLPARNRSTHSPKPDLRRPAGTRVNADKHSARARWRTRERSMRTAHLTPALSDCKTPAPTRIAQRPRVPGRRSARRARLT